MTDGEAEVHNGRLSVSLPLWQVLLFIGGVMIAGFSNYVSAERTMTALGYKIENLTESVDKLNHVVQEMNDRTINNENRLGILEDRADRQGG